MILQLTKNEIRWRKAWLWLLILYPLVHFLFTPWLGFGLLLIDIGYSTLFSYIFYRCAYKKPGTRLLTLALILAPASFAAEIWAIANGVLRESAAIMLAFLVLWAFLCLQMRRINKKLQKPLRDLPTSAAAGEKGALDNG
jgi:hypothetical protein